MGGSKTSIKRGALIVLEGCDRSGKSTQCGQLFDFLQSMGIAAKQMSFPARESNIGKMINKYLKNKQDLPDEVIHLLFSTNRWEFKNEMKNLLESGTTVVVDRYSYSGIAYSVAKGLDYNWCRTPEKGLIRPDIVFYLRASVDALSKRGDFGQERYEMRDFQLKVAQVFDRICEEEKNFWQQLDANHTSIALSALISKNTIQVLKDVEDKPLALVE